MIHVLHLIKGLGRGGAEQLLLSSAPHTDRSRFSYSVAYLLPWKNALVADLEAAGVSVHLVRGDRRPGWIADLRRLIVEHGIDLVHVHSPRPAAVARMALPTRLPIVYTEHNVWGRYRRGTRWANAFTYGRNGHVFAVSDHVLDSIRPPRAFGTWGEIAMERLYHGIDHDRVSEWNEIDGVREELRIPPEAPIVGTVANFKAHKGYELLIEAAATVCRSIPETRFVLVGDGPLRRNIDRWIRERGLEANVVLAGYRPDAQRVAAAFDVFALPSVYEGLSIALVEALALGRPAVVTDVGGLIEVVEDGRQGYVVPTGDAPALAGALLALLQDDELRTRMGQAARERSRSFDIRDAVRRQEIVYAELVRA